MGQYPRFLRAHWKFLKTVVNKLFEFMHETHPGVQDMACDTFLKIVQKCRRKFVIVNVSSRPPHSPVPSSCSPLPDCVAHFQSAGTYCIGLVHLDKLPHFVRRIHSTKYDRHCPGCSAVLSRGFCISILRCGWHCVSGGCGAVRVQVGETEPFVLELLKGLKQTILDLEPHQIHTFYEAVGHMIQAEGERARREEYLQMLMQPPNARWEEIIAQAQQNVDVLKEPEVIRHILNILQTNTSVAASLGQPFLSQIAHIFLNMLNVYRMYSELISAQIKDGAWCSQPLLSIHCKARQASSQQGSETGTSFYASSMNCACSPCEVCFAEGIHCLPCIFPTTHLTQCFLLGPSLPWAWIWVVWGLVWCSVQGVRMPPRARW